jgi:hypothetical protein
MPLAGRLTAVVVGNKPHPICFACLASREGVSEAAVRDAAQVALIRNGLRVLKGTCYRCGRVAEGLMAREATKATE